VKPDVNEANYEDLAGRLYGALIMLDDLLGQRASAADTPFHRGGRVRPGAGGIAGALAQDKIAITGQERAGMLALARQMQMDDLVPGALGSARGPRD